MTDPQPPSDHDRASDDAVPDAPVPGAGGPDAPVLDSLAAEPPAEQPDEQPAAAGAVPGAAGPDQPVLDSFAAEEPVTPGDAATGARTPLLNLPSAPSSAPASADPPAATSSGGLPPAPPDTPPADPPRGSEGLTTAPPPLSAPAPPAPAAAPPAPDEGTPAPAPTAEAAPAAAQVPPSAPATDAPATAPAPAAAAAPAPAAASEQVSPPESGRGRTWLPLFAVGLAVALLAAGTGVLAWQLRQQDRAEQARVQAIAAARDAARLLFSYDHSTLQQDFERGLAVTTGEFRTQYQRTTKEVVSPVATQYKAVVMAEVVEAAVIDADADEVVALVFLNQATTSTRVQGQQVDQSRVRMRLVPRDGRWLVEEVKAL